MKRKGFEMEIIINQARLKYNYEYKIYTQSKLILTGKANRTILPIRRKLEIFDPFGNNICSLKQENLFKYVMSCIPILNMFKIIKY